jgi:uncharacterized membrane protein
MPIDIGRIVGVFLAFFVFGILTVASIVRIKHRYKKIKDETGITEINRLGIVFDYIILIGTISIFLYYVLMQIIYWLNH